MFDYERLSEHEKANFDQEYGELMQEMMVHIARLPPLGHFIKNDELRQEYQYKVNYRVFNLEALLELRLNLIEFLSQ